MSSVRCGIVVCLLLMAFGAVGYASDGKDNIQFEPIFGIGYATSGVNSGMGYHGGVRILSNANPTKRWGGEITYVSPFGFKESLSHKNYIAVGIILQQVFWKHFVGTIGTIGYVGVDQIKNNPFGFVWDIGWEPNLSERVQLFIAVRSETIFDTSTISRHSISLGIKF